ncbi:MAG: RnfABCDGE type electron transport complex subunit B [Sedimentisphaerales bacterium]|nr:RnfABCDGE type electron transport complex subunit B [Sedimentisphaerales bacterium]
MMLLANIFDLWQSAWPAGAIMLGLGTVFAIVLLVASEKLKVHVDPKIEEIHKALPGLDCGACGFAGCGQYAKSIMDNPDLLGKCSPGGAAASAKIAEILNLHVSESGPQQRPVVHCRAHSDDKTLFAHYDGIESCVAVNALANVQACAFGCLGYGDCVAACKFDALHIVDGLATIDYKKCTGCTACVKACPRNLIEMVPFSQENMMVVACRNKESGKVTRSVCKVGCIGCGICVKQTDLFSVSDNFARMNYAGYEPGEKTETAMNKCPTKVIVYRGKSAPEPEMPKEKPVKAKPAETSK